MSVAASQAAERRQRMAEQHKEKAIEWMSHTEVGIVAEGCYTYERLDEPGHDKIVHKKTLLKGAKTFGLKFAFHPSLASPKYYIQINLWIDSRPRAETVVKFDKHSQPAFHWLEAALVDQVTKKRREHVDPFRFGKENIKVIVQAAAIDRANRKGRPVPFGPKATYMWTYKGWSEDVATFEQNKHRIEADRLESSSESGEPKVVVKSAHGTCESSKPQPALNALARRKGVQESLDPLRSGSLFKEPVPVPKRKLGLEDSDDEEELRPPKRPAPARPTSTLATAPVRPLAKSARRNPVTTRATPTTRPNRARAAPTTPAQLTTSTKPAQPAPSARAAVKPTSPPADLMQPPAKPFFSTLLASVGSIPKKRPAPETPTATLAPPAKVSRRDAALATPPATPTVPTLLPKSSPPFTPTIHRQPNPSRAPLGKRDTSPQWFVPEGTSFTSTPLGDLQKWLYTRANKPTTAELQNLDNLFKDLEQSDLASREKVQAEKVLSIFILVKYLRGDGKSTEQAARQVLDKLVLQERAREYFADIYRAARTKDAGTKWVRDAIVKTLKARSRSPGDNSKA